MDSASPVRVRGAWLGAAERDVRADAEDACVPGGGVMLTASQQKLKTIIDARITERQHEIIRWIGANGRVDDCEAVVAIGPARVRTLESLERRGLVRYYPYGGHGTGVWGLTQLGRRVAAIEVES
jgi:hypothetical protein